MITNIVFRKYFLFNLILLSFFYSTQNLNSGLNYFTSLDKTSICSVMVDQELSFDQKYKIKRLIVNFSNSLKKEKNNFFNNSKEQSRYLVEIIYNNSKGKDACHLDSGAHCALEELKYTKIRSMISKFKQNISEICVDENLEINLFLEEWPLATLDQSKCIIETTDYECLNFIKNYCIMARRKFEKEDFVRANILINKLIFMPNELISKAICQIMIDSENPEFNNLFAQSRPRAYPCGIIYFFLNHMLILQKMAFEKNLQRACLEEEELELKKHDVYFFKPLKELISNRPKITFEFGDAKFETTEYDESLAITESSNELLVTPNLGSKECVICQNQLLEVFDETKTEEILPQHKFSKLDQLKIKLFGKKEIYKSEKNQSIGTKPPEVKIAILPCCQLLIHQDCIYRYLSFNYQTARFTPCPHCKKMFLLHKINQKFEFIPLTDATITKD